MTDAIALWPLLEQSDVPLVSPVPVNPFNGWLSEFYGLASERGYRIDYTAVHWYGNPDASSLIGTLQSVYNTWGRPVWLTEFSPVDWGGSETWTEENNYRFLSEFLWRAEDLTWLKRYAVFCFNDAPPANPWDRSGPTGSMFNGDGTTFTAYGQLYASWDGDRTRHVRTPYFIHGLGSMHRLRASSTTNAPSTGDIRRGDVSAQWALVPAPTVDRWYIVSLRDGRRLRYDGTTLELASPGTTGTLAEWGFNGPDANGYTFIDHHATSRSLRLARVNDGNGAPTALNFSMEPFGTVQDATRWRFIKPFQSVETAAPATLAGLNAVGGSNRVTLTWIVSAASDLLHYSVYRSTTPGGPYARVATGLTSPSHVDNAVVQGAVYRYVVTATDWIDNESGYSAEANATPIPPQLAIASIPGSNGAPDNLQVTWFGSGPPRLRLYSATNLNQPVYWTLTTNPVTFTDGLWTVNLPVITNGNQFLRLQSE